MKILIACNALLLRDLFAHHLVTEHECDVDCADTLDQALDKLDGEKVYDLVMLNIAVEGMLGLTGLKQLVARPNASRVVLVTERATEPLVTHAREAGAAGVVPQTLGGSEIVSTVLEIADGGTYYPPAEHIQPETADAPVQDLTFSPREMQVLEQLSAGRSNKEIARVLGIRVSTVKLHVGALYRKLGASNRTQAAIRARNIGVL
ncbi:response regulator transcription factor [Palleronia sp. LCG004]|uniref:response regulator transcription factor n=1 Tax=Palleronia sp. LCG004 TaxID=3079304 RepID=UPI002941FD95|nr:response regulator transcription factor [Palleronia sp. LCG004]WOI56942.1 response regulator transcription factor [Palleronia sp. LCG004]